MRRHLMRILPLLFLVALPALAHAGWGHHHRYGYYQTAPVYAAPVYSAPVYSAPLAYAPQAPAASPSSSLADLLLPIVIDSLRDRLSRGGEPTSREPASDSSLRGDLQKLQADLADFRREQAGANESLGINVQRQGQELATVRADLEAMKTKLDVVLAATGSGSTMQDAIANINKRFPQRSKAEIRATLLDELNKKIKAQSKLNAMEQQTLIDALTKDFDAQLDAAFPSWKE